MGSAEQQTEATCGDCGKPIDLINAISWECNGCGYRSHWTCEALHDCPANKPEDAR